jgi:hypothetical protein
MTPSSIDIEFATFKQHFLNRVQRHQLGINLGQDDAWGIYGDADALRDQFTAWRIRTNQPLVTTHLPTEHASPGPWHRWMRGKRDHPRSARPARGA